MGGGGGGQESSSYTQSITRPPDYLEPYAGHTASEANRLYQTGGPDYFPNPTFVPFSGETEAALGIMKDRGLNGTELTRGGTGLLTRTINGDFLGSNPWLDETFRRASDATTNAVMSRFGGIGATNSSGFMRAVSDANAGLAADLYGSNYEAERGRQMSAMGLLPAMYDVELGNLGLLRDAGAMREDLSERELQDEIDRFNYYETRPYRMLEDYTRLIGANPGFGFGESRSLGSSATVQKKNRASGALGGAASGASIGAAAGPYGAIAGGVIGALVGGLS